MITESKNRNKKRKKEKQTVKRRRSEGLDGRMHKDKIDRRIEDTSGRERKSDGEQVSPSSLSLLMELERNETMICDFGMLA